MFFNFTMTVALPKKRSLVKVSVATTWQEEQKIIQPVTIVSSSCDNNKYFFSVNKMSNTY